ncbi:MAG TPA: hypothetical protein VFD95_00415 [Usitatibacter sp.]|jgi:hypothetical protein|nr:hypothetical protein [Usitatibacter sp.]
MSTPGDDAQRNMEQRALRNVRALVDKIETTDERDSKSSRRHVAVIVAVILGLFVVAYGVSQMRSKNDDRTVVLPPPAKTAK